MTHNINCGILWVIDPTFISFHKMVLCYEIKNNKELADQAGSIRHIY